MLLAEDGFDFDVLLDEFGADGWELVNQYTRESVVVSKMYGWSNVGTPLSTSWTFKRQAES